jgi:hypothetical protein
LARRPYTGGTDFDRASCVAALTGGGAEGAPRLRGAKDPFFADARSAQWRGAPLVHSTRGSSRPSAHTAARAPPPPDRRAAPAPAAVRGRRRSGHDQALRIIRSRADPLDRGAANSWRKPRRRARGCRRLGAASSARAWNAACARAAARTCSKGRPPGSRRSHRVGCRSRRGNGRGIGPFDSIVR